MKVSRERERRKDCEVQPKSKRQKGFAIDYTDLAALCFASKNIPERTPKRWELTSTLVSDYATKAASNIISPLVTLKENDCASFRL